MGEKMNNFSDIRRADTRCAIGCNITGSLKRQSVDLSLEKYCVKMNGMGQELE
jgi:hypothetical protein